MQKQNEKELSGSLDNFVLPLVLYLVRPSLILTLLNSNKGSSSYSDMFLSVYFFQQFNIHL